MSAEQDNKLMTVREAAQECGRNMETVRRWIWSGKLPAQKLGNQLFTTRGDLASYCGLPAQGLPAKAGETATKPYQAGGAEDFVGRTADFRNKLREEGVKPIDPARLVNKMREDRTKQVIQSLTETAEVLRRRDALLDFSKKAEALRNEIHARTGEVFDAEVMIRELRDQREDELE